MIVIRKMKQSEMKYITKLFHKTQKPIIGASRFNVERSINDNMVALAVLEDSPMVRIGFIVFNERGVIWTHVDAMFRNDFVEKSLKKYASEFQIGFNAI